MDQSGTRGVVRRRRNLADDAENAHLPPRAVAEVPRQGQRVQNLTLNLGLNAFADFPHQEFVAMNTGLKAARVRWSCLVIDECNGKSLARSVDWTTQCGDSRERSRQFWCTWSPLQVRMKECWTWCDDERSCVTQAAQTVTCVTSRPTVTYAALIVSHTALTSRLICTGWLMVLRSAWKWAEIPSV